VTGRALGLVLGGGGARGFAHIGVLRALEEAGLPIDFVGGTSMGALVGGYYGMGRSPSEIIAAAKQFGSSNRLFDYTVPLVSFFQSKKLTAMLQSLFGDAEIEEMWQPFFCLSSNLTQAQPVVHRRGSMWQAIRASLAIPGVFSPILNGEEVLVDGGILNNLPVEEMRILCEGGPVVAVNVSVEKDVPRHYDFGSSVSGWQVLWRKLNPLAPPAPVPSILALLVRSAELNSVHQKRAKQAVSDLFISPPVERFSMLDFRPAEMIAEVGYQAARQALQAEGVVEHLRSVT
jgi:predicted acylesterase/phospholipase RssA